MARSLGDVGPSNPPAFKASKNILEYYELRRKAKALSINVQWVQSQPTQIQRQELQIVMLAEPNIKPARLRSEEKTRLLPLLSHVVAE